MTAQGALKAALRDVVGPSARLHGFQGTSPTWRKQNAAGDWAIVNIQSSSGSSAERLRCLVNVSVAPEPWLRWFAHDLPRAMPKNVGESFGLYRDRLHPSGTPAGSDVWWEVTDTATAVAVAVAEGMVHQLESSGWPLLDRLLEPGQMLAQIRAGSLGHMKGSSHRVFFARAEAVMLMDAGMSSELEECLQLALQEVIPAQRDNALAFDAWIREQAAHGGQSNSEWPSQRT